MPVWRCIVVRFDHAETKDADPFSLPRCAGSRPDFAKILLRLARRRATVFIIAAPVMLHRVVTGRCCQRVEVTGQPFQLRQIFKSAHSRHEFAATVGRIGNTAGDFIDQ